MATKKFPSEMSSRGTVLGTDKILIYNATTGASDEVCTVAELFAYISYIQNQNASAQTATIWISGSGKFGGNINSISTTGSSVYKATNSGGDFYVGIDSSVGADLMISGQSTGYARVINTNSNYPLILGVNNNNALQLNNNLSATFASTIGATGITLSVDNANKPGAGGLWTVVSDERIKTDIELADLDICYDTIKNIPLKRFAWAYGVYSEEQVSDRHNLGWIAQDVQKYFSKAVSVKPFTKNAKIADGIEEYQEQDFVMQPKDALVIEIIDGNPVQVKKTIDEKVLLFDELPVKDELGKVVLENGKPLLAKVPKMVTKTRPKFRQEVIEDCLDLNSGQLNAALYGAVQACMLKIESLEKEIALLKQ